MPAAQRTSHLQEARLVIFVVRDYQQNLSSAMGARCPEACLAAQLTLLLLPIYDVLLLCSAFATCSKAQTPPAESKVLSFFGHHEKRPTRRLSTGMNAKCRSLLGYPCKTVLPTAQWRCNLQDIEKHMIIACLDPPHGTCQLQRAPYAPNPLWRHIPLCHPC